MVFTSSNILTVVQIVILRPRVSRLFPCQALETAIGVDGNRAGKLPRRRTKKGYIPPRYQKATVTV
jgi:hypothetical protein